MVVGENRELDKGGLGSIGRVLLGTSNHHPIVKTNWHVVSEAFLAVAKYQSSCLEIVVHA